MDFNYIKQIKQYIEKIKKFRKLKDYKDLSKEDFLNKMAKIFPKFYLESQNLFKMIIMNDDLSILNLMFKKLEIIEDQCKLRKEEVKIITQFIEDAKIFLSDKKKVKKNQLHNFFKNNKKKYNYDYRKFINKYPVIIDRLIDDDDYDYDPYSLLCKQIRFSHEIDIGKVLTQKYIEPYVKNS